MTDLILSRGKGSFLPHKVGGSDKGTLHNIMDYKAMICMMGDCTRAV